MNFASAQSFGFHGVSLRCRRSLVPSCGVCIGDSHALSDSAPRSGANVCLSEDFPGTPPPILLLEFSVRRQVTIHWGPNPGNEQKNGRAAGTIGCQIQFARGGIPANESSWLVHEIDTESPSFHEVNESAPITMAYCGRYVSKALKFGPYGDPVVCTVSV